MGLGATAPGERVARNKVRAEGKAFPSQKNPVKIWRGLTEGARDF